MNLWELGKALQSGEHKRRAGASGRSCRHVVISNYRAHGGLSENSNNKDMLDDWSALLKSE